MKGIPLDFATTYYSACKWDVLELETLRYIKMTKIGATN